VAGSLARPLTRNEQLALAASAIIVATFDDNLRELSAKDRAIALAGRDKAWKMLMATGLQPTDLKELAYVVMENPLQ
jgi:hypothetical protein